MEIKEKVFKPRADILIQLGDQLIKNENIALLELVKILMMQMQLLLILNFMI